MALIRKVVFTFLIIVLSRAPFSQGTQREMVKQAYSNRQKHLKLYLLKPLRVEGHLNLQNKNIYT